jgi:hypothetical protein
MPVYEYLCPENGQTVEITHSITESLKTWGELCKAAGLDTGKTPKNSPVERLLFVPGVSSPAGDSKLKEMGFTKLVKRDSGVYENVTASEGESRYVKAGDSTTLPNLKRKIRD